MPSSLPDTPHHRLLPRRKAARHGLEQPEAQILPACVWSDTPSLQMDVLDIVL